MQNKSIVRAITLYDKEADMVIGTLLQYQDNEPIPWVPSNGILYCNGDGYSSDAGYAVIVNVVNRDTGWKVFIDGNAYWVTIRAFD